MARIQNLALKVERDSTSPSTYTATARYDVVFSRTEVRDRVRIRDTFTLLDDDDGSDRADLIQRVSGEFRAERTTIPRRLVIRRLTDNMVRQRASEDDIEASARVTLYNLDLGDNVEVDRAVTRPFNLSLET